MADIMATTERPSPAPKKLFGYAVARKDGSTFHVMVAADDRETLDDVREYVRKRVAAEGNTLVEGGWHGREAILCTECERNRASVADLWQQAGQSSKNARPKQAKV